ncbi:hypothetical protein BH20GEM2_BH20GEM2_12040 [soil metagenome]
MLGHKLSDQEIEAGVFRPHKMEVDDARQRRLGIGKTLSDFSQGETELTQRDYLLQAEHVFLRVQPVPRFARRDGNSSPMLS